HIAMRPDARGAHYAAASLVDAVLLSIADDVTPDLLVWHAEYVRDELSGDQFAHGYRIEAVGICRGVILSNPRDGGLVACSFDHDAYPLFDDPRPIGVMLDDRLGT